jgi:hypothetical protein
MTLVLNGTNGLSDVDGSAATPAIRGTDTNTGIFFPAADTIGFAEGGTEAMRIDSSGNVGIGTASPAQKLHISGTGDTRLQVESTSSGAGVIYLNGSTAGFAGYNTIQSRNSSTVQWAIGGSGDQNTLPFYTNGSERMRIASNGRAVIGSATEDAASQLKVLNGLGGATGNPWEQSTLTLTGDAAMAQGVGPIISFEGNYLTGTGSGANFAWIKAAKTNGTSGSATGDLILGSRGGNIRFSNDATNSGLATERARIDSSGNLLVGATSTGYTDSRLVLSLDNSTKWVTGPGAGIATRFYVSASNSGGVYLNGTSATSWTAISDERFKSELLPIENATEKVVSLRAVTGVLTLDESKTRKAFLMAQDVLAVLPEAVDTTNPEQLGLAYTDVIPLLVAAIKEQQALITTLTDRITALEAKP